MVRRKHFVTAAIVIAMLGLALTAQAAIVTYELRADGLASGTGAGGAIMASDLGGSTGTPDAFQLEIWAKVTNNVWEISEVNYDLGLLQFNANIDGGHGSALEAREGDSGFPAYIPTGNWVSTIDADFSIAFAGDVTQGSPADVNQVAGQIPTANWVSNLVTHSANVWTKVAEGTYDWDGEDGTARTLTLSSLLGGNIVAIFPADPTYGHTLTTGDSAVGDTVTLGVPEPSSILMLLTGLAGLAMCWWRRR